MNYAEDILKHEAYYYKLTRATIIDGVLRINTRGTASCEINTSDLAYLTSTFQFNCTIEPYNDRYMPVIKATITVKISATDDWYTVDLFPINAVDSTYSCIFELPDGEYSNFTFTIYSPMPCTITMWELRPEALSENIEVIIDGVRQSLPRLLYDYNTFDFTADVYETSVGLITCRLIDNTDIQGHFVATFIATEACTVVVRFYDNNSEELFSPLYYDVAVGYNTLGIPHSFLKRSAGMHTFVVSMQAFAGELQFDTRGILFTIDGGYLAARALDIGINVLDLAIRQPAYMSGPDEIWLIGLDAGEVLIRKRSYTDTNANVAFTHVASMGKGAYGAIEFNGLWVFRRDIHKYTIETYEEPFVFIIRANGDLFVYNGVNDEEPYLLDTNVTIVKACRGYHSILYPEQDHGLVAAYIKSNGEAWYAQYCYDQTTETHFWLSPILLDAGPWNHIVVSRLNDYRLSFQLSDDDHNVWIYTERLFVGQSVMPEIFSIKPAYDSRSFYYGREAAVVEFDEVTYTYDSASSGYDWTVVFHVNEQLVFRPAEYDLNSHLTIGGTMADRVKSTKWDDDLNSIVMVFNMPRQPDRTPYASCDLTLVSNTDIVALIGAFSYNFVSINYLFEMSNVVQIVVEPKEQFNLMPYIAQPAINYIIAGHITSNTQESFDLSATQLTSDFAYRSIEKSASYTEETANIMPTISGTFTYSGTHVKPI